jgi:4-phytase/acid phosphatase
MYRSYGYEYKKQCAVVTDHGASLAKSFIVYRLERLTMNLFKCSYILAGLLLVLAIAAPVTAQTVTNEDDGTTLKQIIIFGRHSIRAAITDPSSMDRFSADPYPGFAEVPKGYLTPNGQEAASLLGNYFREYLLHEGLLTNDAATDINLSYFRANSIQRSNITAAMFGAGLIPGTPIPVHSYSIGDDETPAEPDPIFDPILANVVSVDLDRAVTEVHGIFSSGAAIESAYSGELALIRSVLFDYPQGTQPPPDTPSGKTDPTAQPITLTANSSIPRTGNLINFGGLLTMNLAIDPFVMQYADGFPLEDVAWGRLSLNALSQQTRLATLQIAIAMRMPYINQVQSSNAASHVLRSMRQAVRGSRVHGSFGTAKSKILVIISSDYYVAGLAGLLDLHWTLPGYQPDFCSPGGALVFELRQVRKTKKHLVRVFYTSQTFDQLRNLTPLTLDEPPATMQLAVPGGSKSAASLNVAFSTFKKITKAAIDRKYVQPFREEDPPGVIEDVPLD